MLRRLLVVGLVVTAFRLLVTPSGGLPANALAKATVTRYDPNPVLTRGGVGTWDHDTVAGEQVFYDLRLGQWVMVYSGLDKAIDDGGVGQVGIAYARSPQGPWTKDAGNPVFSPSMAEQHIATANVIQLADLSYRMYYQDYGPAHAKLYAATSTNLTSWTRLNSSNPVLDLGASGQWDDDQLFDPAPLLVGTQTYLWYGGQKADGSRGIGLAIAADDITFVRQGRLFTPAAGESNVSYGAPAVLFTDPTHYSIFHDAALTGSNTTRFICRQDTTDGSTFTHNHQVLTANGGSSWGETVQVFDPAPVLWYGALYLFYAGSSSTGSGTGLSPDIGLASMRWP